MTIDDIDSLRESVIELLSGEFCPMDGINFIRKNPDAWNILKKSGSYDDELRYIEEHDDCEIEHVLNTPHIEYYDSDYGSLDPLTGFRIFSSEDIIDIEDYDNYLTHILYLLDEVVVDIPHEEVLTRDNLEMLLNGEADCDVDNIYYYEKTGSSTFIWGYYYRDRKGNWDALESEYELEDVQWMFRLIEDDTPGNTDYAGIIRKFYDYFRYSFTWLDQPICQRKPFPVIEAEVFNGTEAIKALYNDMNLEIRSLGYELLRRLYSKECKQYRQ